jgi:hypothetical protein
VRFVNDTIDNYRSDLQAMPLREALETYTSNGIE